MILSRTDLTISQSKAKAAATSKEYAGDLGVSVAQQQPSEKVEKCVFQAQHFRYFCLVSKNEAWGIVRNAFCQSLAVVQAVFEG